MAQAGCLSGHTDGPLDRLNRKLNRAIAGGIIGFVLVVSLGLDNRSKITPQEWSDRAKSQLEAKLDSVLAEVRAGCPCDTLYVPGE